MGVLDATLPLRAWGFPYALFLVGAAGRLTGTKVAMVSVGADIVNKRATRWLLTGAARLSFYRSYRDAYSRDAMNRMGLDVSRDPVYPDLVFSLPVPSREAGDPRTVAVGVMAYYGSNDDRHRAGAIYASYIADVTSFVRWLVDDGRKVRLLIGDANGSDGAAAQDILAALRAERPDLASGQVVAGTVSTVADVFREMSLAGTVIGTRYHNVVCALRAGQADDLARLLRQAPGPDDRHGGSGILPAGQPSRRRPADQAVLRAREPVVSDPPAAHRTQPVRRAAPGGAVRRPVCAAPPGP